MKKNRSLIVGGLILIGMVIAIPILVNIAFDTPASFEFMVAKYSAGEFLSYIAASLAFIGTMFLGFISYKQNRDLQKREDDSFIAANACMALINDIGFYEIQCDDWVIRDDLACPIMKSDGAINGNCSVGSFLIIVGLQRIENYPVLVKMDFATITYGLECIASLKPIHKHYTHLTISENACEFSIGATVTSEEKEKLKEVLLKDKNSAEIRMQFELITSKRVSTRLDCRTYFDVEAQKGFVKHQINKGTSACYWLGNRIVDIKELQI